MNDEQRPSRMARWRAGALAGIVVLGLASIVGSGGGGCFAPGPCVGDFPNEPIAPVVTPTDVVVEVGGTATFSAIAQGIGNPSYQWLRAPKGGTLAPISGATASTYSLTGANLTDDGSTIAVDVAGSFEGKAVQRRSAGSTLAVSSMLPVVFQDREFAPADWAAAAIVEPLVGGPTHDEQQARTGGNPDAYRRVALSMPGGVSTLTAFSTYQSASYDPASQGAIYLIDFAQDCIALPGVLGVAPVLLVEQDGRRYAAAAGAGACTAVWGRQTLIRGTFDATQFIRIDGAACAAGASCPDFSAFGKPLKFGIVNFNQGVAGFAGASGGFGIDNWVVRVWRR